MDALGNIVLLSEKVSLHIGNVQKYQPFGDECFGNDNPPVAHDWGPFQVNPHFDAFLNALQCNHRDCDGWASYPGGFA